MDVKVVNQFGKYIAGRDREIILNAVEADKASLLVDGVYVGIVGIVKTDEEMVVKVQVDV